MGTAQRLLDDWRISAPKLARYDDAVLVAKTFLGEGNVKEAKSTSHTCIIDGPIMKEALKYQALGLSELAWLDGPTFALPRSKGTKISGIYINNLLKLIGFSQKLDDLERTRRNGT